MCEDGVLSGTAGPARPGTTSTSASDADLRRFPLDIDPLMRKVDATEAR